MEWIDIEEAKSRRGVRLVLAKGGWAVWSECAKNILHYKNIPYAPVAQLGFEDNPELVAWTGVRNQPQLVFDNESVHTHWLDILTVTERIAPEPRLLPEDVGQRTVVVGLAHELCGEMGFGWCRRIQIMGDRDLTSRQDSIMKQEYGARQWTADKAARRCVDIVSMLGRRLRDQRETGSPFFVGNNLTAIDIYWACFSNLLRAMPADVCPMDDGLRAMMDSSGPLIDAATDPILFEHRDHVYTNYLPLPMNFG